MIFYVKLSTLCFIFFYIHMVWCFGTTRDQTSQRANTLSDDKDDIQKQLDNEARDRLQYATPKTIWVLHFPTHMTQMPHSNKRRMWYSITSKQNAKRDYNQHDVFNQQWRKNRDISSLYCARGSRLPSVLPKKQRRRITARVPLPVNRYQTKTSHLRTVRMNDYKRRRKEGAHRHLPWIFQFTKMVEKQTF